MPNLCSASIIANEDSIVYRTEKLTVKRLTAHVYQHISFLKTDDFGKVQCNGMLVINDGEAIIFDTPADNESSEELINCLTKHKYKITALIATHFHADCVAGLESFNKYFIPCYALDKTIELLKNKDNKFFKTLKGFKGNLCLTVGKEKVYARYFGEGHTKDNIVGYFPQDEVVFGGCLIKELDAQKGNLEDANVIAWPETVKKVKLAYSRVRIVIPGHGKSGGTELFDYTIKLFEKITAPAIF